MLKYTRCGEIPKWPKGLASNTSRSVVPARGFKSLSLRQLCPADAGPFYWRGILTPRGSPAGLGTACLHMNKIAIYVKKQRKQSGLTQEEFAM